MRLPIRVRSMPADEKTELERLYCQTKDMRICECVQMILLSCEQQTTIAQHRDYLKPGNVFYYVDEFNIS